MKKSYLPNSENRICGFERSSDEFHMQKKGTATWGENIIGHSIWNFTCGCEAQNFLNAILFAVRNEAAELETIYRWGRRSVRRLFLMSKGPFVNGGIRVDNTLLKQSGDRLVDYEAVLDHNCCHDRYSTCCHFQVADKRADAICVTEETTLPESHVVCPSCKVKARIEAGETVGPSTKQLSTGQLLKADLIRTSAG